MVTLKFGAGELVLAPERGGCVSAFRWHGTDILRPFDASLGSDAPATDYAAFPLAPFSGRIANGKFSFDGTSYALPSNFPPEPHAIHGIGWQRPWEISERSDRSATLILKEDSGDWPWAFEAMQRFKLVDDGLKVELALTNLSNRPMPGGIGWHPYFPAGGAKVRTDVSAIWESGDDMIPAAPSDLSGASDLRMWRNASELSLDNAFAFGGHAEIEWPGHGISLAMSSSDTLRHLIAYTPRGEDFFCVEPVSHSPDAVNAAEPPEITGLRVLAPGETLTGTIKLIVQTSTA